MSFMIPESVYTSADVCLITRTTVIFSENATSPFTSRVGRREVSACPENSGNSKIKKHTKSATAHGGAV
jgi:hypothetical protein